MEQTQSATEMVIAKPDRYTRAVRLAKRVLPALAALIVLSVVIWPLTKNSQSGFTLAFEELKQFDDTARMVKPRFVGTDMQDRSFSITAETAYHDAGDDEMVMLDTISADVRMLSGEWLALDAPTGIFRPKDEILDLSGQVNVFSGSGFEVHTRQLQLNLSSGTGRSEQPVYGQGAFGVFEAGGAEVDVKGEYLKLSDGVAMTVYPRAIE
ncbi:MAG: LPS export ABC transporter periplasmic protein LptC [Alphaproteobacteria bacterium]